MNEICIPVNLVQDCEHADVEVRLPDTGREIHFRLECLKMTKQDSSDQRVNQIRNFIDKYNDSWELIQILDTPKGCDYVQLLYREHS